MKAKWLVAVAVGALMGLVAACGRTEPDATSSTEPTVLPPVAGATAEPGASPASTQEPPTPETPENVYQNPDYRFAFVIPEGWSLEDQSSTSADGTQTRHALLLTKDEYELIFEFSSVFDQVRIGPSGLPAGELTVQPDALTVFGRPTSEYVLTYQDKVKVVFYDLRVEDLRGFVVLQQNAGLELAYEDADLTPEIRGELAALLGSLSRTGVYQLPDSVSMLAEFPVILPMEKSYYSQIYDTAVANACGPAVATMVLNYYGRESSLQTVIDRLRSLPGPGAFDPNCYVNTVCTSPAALAAVLAEYGLDAQLHENWTLLELFEAVSSGYPVIADILWDAATDSLGHFVVVYGIDLERQLLYYHDPYRGSEMTAGWDDFAALWEGRVDVGDPVQPEGHRFWGLEVRPPAAGQ